MISMIKFLTIARVLYDKGFNELIECAKFYSSPRYNAEFSWLGAVDTEYSQAVPEKEIMKWHNSGIIKYLGFHHDVRNYIKESDCIILPSYHEGMSRVLMESLAMHKPIITSNIPGCRETVIEGINGFLCQPHDAKSLIECVDKFFKLTTEEKRNMSIESRKLAETRFDINNVITVYNNILREADLIK